MSTPLSPLQLSNAFDQVIADGIAYLPTLIGAIVILLIGYILGRILGRIVTRVIRRVGIGKYTAGTAIEELASGDGIARALGKIVSYYVYFVALVAAANILGIDQLTGLLAEIGAFLPVILGALIVLVLGFIIARILGNIVAGVVGGFGIGRHLQETPLASVGDDLEFGNLVGKLVTYYVYLLTLLAVADILAIDALSTLLNDFAGYLPALIGGLLILLVGIWLAEHVADVVTDSGEGRPIHLASFGVKVLIYYIAITLALATIGINISVLTTLFGAFVVAFFGSLALALALGIGLAVGLGGQDYVAENIGSWIDSAKSSMGEADD